MHACCVNDHGTYTKQQARFHSGKIGGLYIIGEEMLLRCVVLTDEERTDVGFGDFRFTTMRLLLAAAHIELNPC